MSAENSTQLLFCSDLLEEDEEPFEVLPGGRVGPCLYAVLKVLYADALEFRGWHGIAGESSSL